MPLWKEVLVSPYWRCWGVGGSTFENRCAALRLKGGGRLNQVDPWWNGNVACYKLPLQSIGGHRARERYHLRHITRAWSMGLRRHLYASFVTRVSDSAWPVVLLSANVSRVGRDGETFKYVCVRVHVLVCLCVFVLLCVFVRLQQAQGNSSRVC